MNKYDYAKEEVYNALWALCDYDDETYHRVCSGECVEPIMQDVINLAVKLSNLSQDIGKEETT